MGGREEGTWRRKQQGVGGNDDLVQLGRVSYLINPKSNTFWVKTRLITSTSSFNFKG